MNAQERQVLMKTLSHTNKKADIMDSAIIKIVLLVIFLTIIIMIYALFTDRGSNILKSFLDWF